MRGALLDTMAILFAAYQPGRLSGRASERILERNAGPVFYSAVSLWEIGLKLSTGGFREAVLGEDWHELLPQGLAEQGIDRIEVEPRHCRIIAELPFHHRDPFDRMIFAQAIAGGLAVVSSDLMASRYVEEVIW